MSIFNVKRIKRIEDLLAEAASISAVAPNVSSGVDQASIEQYDSWLDKFLDKAIDPSAFNIADIKQRTRIVETYLEYCNNRLLRISDKIKKAVEKTGSSQNEIKDLTDQQFAIAKKITLLDEIYSGMKNKEDAEIQEIADEIVKRVEEIQTTLQNEYFSIIEAAGKRNYALLQDLARSKDDLEKREISKEIISTWEEVKIITSNLDPAQRAQMDRLQNQTYSNVEREIGKDRLETLVAGSAMNREEADLIARIVKLNYRVFTSEKQVRDEFADIRLKVNSLQGSSKYKNETRPETIKYLTTLVDQAELSIVAKFKDKSIDLSKTQGVHFDYNKRLKLYEKTELPVTGKQIADSSVIMKLRKGLTSLLDLLFGGGRSQVTPEGDAWSGFGSKVQNIYSKTLNTAAKAAGRLIKGREGEIKADALSRLFIPDTDMLAAKTSRSLYEEAVAPGVASQVPGSIGGMGAIVAPTPTSIGSGDNFNPKNKSKDKKRKKVLEFNDFVSQFLK